MDEGAVIDRIAELMRSHVGKGNAITSGKIASMFGIPDNDTTRQTRHLIKEAMKKYGLAIGALPVGYFIVESKEELAECALDLQNRIDRTEERLVLLKRNYYGTHGEPGDPDSDDE
jgi:hypothetical protein